MPIDNQTRESEQDADTGNRGPCAKEWCGVIEQPQMGDLAIEAAIARVAVEAHRHRFGVVRSGAECIAGAVLR
jgi:hypothetical protein